MTKNGLPRGLLMHQFRQRRRGVLVRVKGVRNQVSHVFVGERCEDDLVYRCSGASDAIEGAQERMASRDFVVPVRADQQHVAHVRMRQQVFEQIERGRVEPLQIIEEEGQRMIGSREHREEAAQDQLKTSLRVLGR